jgi:hypothetical protein
MQSIFSEERNEECLLTSQSAESQMMGRKTFSRGRRVQSTTLNLRCSGCLRWPSSLVERIEPLNEGQQMFFSGFDCRDVRGR